MAVSILFPSVEIMNRRVLVAALFVASHPLVAQGFSSSDVQAKYGWSYRQPGIAEDVPKNIFTFENTSAGRWWSSYLFVDAARSWSDADANAKEVYGEWYPALSLRGVSGKPRSSGFVRDVSIAIGLNTGVRSTGTSPFVVLPGVKFDLNVPAFTFFSLGAYAYVDRGRFEGQPTDCHANTYQITPSWSLPFSVGAAKLKVDGFVDFIGSHANCEAQVLTQPRLALDVSGLWHQPGRVYVAVDYSYWHNKYGISGLQDNVIIPVLVWVI